MNVFNWIMGKAFDAEEEVENMQQCAVCVKSPLSGSDRYDTGSTKRFSKFGRAFAQRFRGTGNADREGFLQDVTVALRTPAGEGVQAFIYADGAHPGDGALLAQSEVVRMRPPGPWVICCSVAFTSRRPARAFALAEAAPRARMQTVPTTDARQATRRMPED